MIRAKMVWLGGVALAVVALLLLFGPRPAKSAECPPGMASCKVLVVSPEQAEMIDQIITNTCITGPYSQIHQVVQFYKEMLVKAPAGTVAASAVPTPPKKP